MDAMVMLWGMLCSTLQNTLTIQIWILWEFCLPCKAIETNNLICQNMWIHSWFAIYVPLITSLKESGLNKTSLISVKRAWCLCFTNLPFFGEHSSHGPDIWSQENTLSCASFTTSDISWYELGTKNPYDDQLKIPNIIDIILISLASW